MNSYGKTWHFWPTGGDASRGERLPVGPPTLAWSFNRDGEMNPKLFAALRDRGIDAGDKRAERESLCLLAHRQRGVTTIRDAFPDADGAPPGIREAR
jgi:hypothetical protein